MFVYVCVQVLRKIARYIKDQNEKIYAPRGLLLTDPIERGLRVVSFLTSCELPYVGWLICIVLFFFFLKNSLALCISLNFLSFEVEITIFEDRSIGSGR